MLIRNFSAHLEEGGGEGRERELSLSCSLLSPCFFPILHSVPWPLHLPTPSPLPQSGVYHSGWIRAPYLDADLSFLCTATGERKISNPCLLASPLLLFCAHTHIHTFAYLLSVGCEKGHQPLIYGWAAAAGGWRGAGEHGVPPSLGTQLWITCCLPEACACQLSTAPAARSPVSKPRGWRKLEGLPTAAVPLCLSLCIDPACSKHCSPPGIVNCPQWKEKSVNSPVF